MVTRTTGVGIHTSREEFPNPAETSALDEDRFMPPTPRIDLTPLTPTQAVPSLSGEESLKGRISPVQATLYENVSSPPMIDLKRDNDNFLFPIQTPSMHLISDLENMSSEEMRPYLQHYAAVASYAENPANEMNLDGQSMLLVPSMRGYFSDSSEEAGHVLCLPKQGQHAREIAQIMEEIFNIKSHLDDDGTDAEQLKSLYGRLKAISESTSSAPRNEPQVAMLLEMLEKPVGTVDRVFGQNCAPGSASCPSNLHLQVLPKSAFPLLDLTPSQRFIDEVSSLRMGDKTLSVQGVNAPGTVLGINVSDLDSKDLATLGHCLNDLVKSQTKPDSFGVDFLTSTEKTGEKYLYIAFRNQEKGGLYQSFGIFDPSQLQSLDADSSEVRTDKHLSELNEPASQMDTAAFLAKLKRDLLK